jgi:hypothetical protein
MNVTASKKKGSANRSRASQPMIGTVARALDPASAATTSPPAMGIVPHCRIMINPFAPASLSLGTIFGTSASRAGRKMRLIPSSTNAMP